MPHIGDARIGERVNVGAGTITCNYDGVKQASDGDRGRCLHRLRHPARCPVTVGRGATLGAGTTLTKDAPPDTLTVSRARQVSLPSWQRPVKISKK